jgi:MoaA/NifB/PqqE/SkfB family radical SAM enzyme
MTLTLKTPYYKIKEKLMNQFIFAQIEPTTKCNFTCGFCCGRKMDQSNLLMSDFQKFLAMFPEIKHLELQGEGEPLIHPDFFEMVNLASNQGINISLITNGSLFTQSNIEKILNSKINSIRISMESSNSEQFYQIRGGSLEVVKNGIIMLMEQRNQRELTRPSVGLAVTVLASTLKDLPHIFELYCDLGLDGGIAIQFLNKMPQYRQFYDEKMEQEYLVKEKHQEEYFNYMSGEIVRKVWQEKSPHSHFYDELFKPRPADLAKGKLTICPWLEEGIYVDRHGRITPCCTIKAENWSFGTLATLDRQTIINERAKLAQKLQQGQIPAPCQGCQIALNIIS